MYYEVVITTKNGQYTGVFRSYNEAEEFVRTAVLHSREKNTTVIISAKGEE